MLLKLKSGAHFITKSTKVSTFIPATFALASDFCLYHLSKVTRILNF